MRREGGTPQNKKKPFRKERNHLPAAWKRPEAMRRVRFTEKKGARCRGKGVTVRSIRGQSSQEQRAENGQTFQTRSHIRPDLRGIEVILGQWWSEGHYRIS